MDLENELVVDAVTHAFDNRPENCRVRYAELHNEANFGAQKAFLPQPYQMTRDEYFRAFEADEMIDMLFYESQTDIVCYHSIPAWGVWHDNSPMSVGLEMRRRLPGRVYLYGAVSPADGPKALADLERQAEEWGPIHGVKLYPADFVDGEFIGVAMNDEQRVYPILEKCRELSIRTVAIHKSIPLAGMPMDPYRPGDVDYAARDFPDLNFEVVHAGFAFLQETAFQLARYPNIYANLEANSALLVRQPRVVAKMLGELLFWGAERRLMWGTGAMAFHPRPLLEAFAKLEMPQDLIEDCGYPPLTDDVKRAILADNWLEMHGLDREQIVREIAGDEVQERRASGLLEPWSRLRSAGARA